MPSLVESHILAGDVFVVFCRKSSELRKVETVLHKREGNCDVMSDNDEENLEVGLANTRSRRERNVRSRGRKNALEVKPIILYKK